MRPDAERWLTNRTSTAADWPVADLLAVKAGTTVSVVLPALDEEATVGAIVATLRSELVDRSDPLVDELVVMDSGSADRTAQVAADAGARVVQREDVLPELAPLPGKGEVLWRSLAATRGDLLVFVDADLEGVRADYVTGLLGPLLSDPTVALVKAVFDRPLVTGGTVLPAGGGRVTELVARPLLNLFWPELAGVVQPLVGEYAARRSLLERLPFPTGYGVDLALLVDTCAARGLPALAQVDLGVRRHRHQNDDQLGRMASEIWQTALARLEQEGRLRASGPLGSTLTQFGRENGALVARDHDVGLTERPPMLTVPGYRTGSAGRAS